MRHDFIDRYSRIESPVHQLSTGFKVSAAIILILCTILLPIHSYGYFILISICLIGVSIISRIPAKYLLSRLIILEPFVLGVSILSLFQPKGEIIFVTILVKSSICLYTIILLTNTTPFSKILDWLKVIHIPSLFVTILALMYRYIFVLIDDAERMERARASRSFSTNKRQIWKIRAMMIGQIFIRSIERADRIYSAMRARGWK
ncbi:MAG: cobalt ECF transporter T component CbiQ [Bacteroidota bacterium]|nr:cobalt ECF transporter T component CbiQ [Bacteroidota bacterium]